MFRKIINTGLSKVLSLIFTFLIGVIISRVYGANGKGEITLLLLIPTLISVYASFSIGEGFLYFIGKNKISKTKFDELLIKTIVYFLPILIIIYLLTYFFINRYTYYFLPQLFLIIALFYSTILKFSIRGVLNFSKYNIAQIVEPLFIIVFLIALVYLKIDIKILLWAYAISYTLLNFYLYYFIKKKLKEEQNNITFKTIFNYSYKVHFFRILNFTEAKFDILIIGYFLAISEVGIYSIAVSITLIFQSIIQTSISTVLLPTLVKSKYDEQISVTQNYFKLSLSLAFLFLVFLIIIGKFFILKVYGEEFSTAYLPMIILLIGALIKSPTACINSFFKSTGKPEELYKTSIYSVIINIILCYILIPIYGIVGAAISSSVSYFIYGTIMIYKFKKTSNFALQKLIVNFNDIKNIINLVKERIKR